VFDDDDEELKPNHMEHMGRFDPEWKKAKRLARLLAKTGSRIPKISAMGLVSALGDPHFWDPKFPTGPLAPMSPERVAELVGWEGDAESLVRMLVEAEILEPAAYRVVQPPLDS